MSDVLYIDIMGYCARGGFDQHFDKIGPYFANANVAYKDLEIIAVSKTFGYTTMFQHYWGRTSSGDEFDFTYRITSQLAKLDGKWKWVHEHLSFPVDVATGQADMMSTRR